MALPSFALIDGRVHLVGEHEADRAGLPMNLCCTTASLFRIYDSGTHNVANENWSSKAGVVRAIRDEPVSISAEP